MSPRDHLPDSAFAAVFDAMPVALALVDGDKRYVRVNASFARLVGLDPREIVGKQVGDLALVGESVDLGARWTRLLRGGGPSVAVYLSELGGEPRWLEVDPVPAAVQGLHLMVLRDVTTTRRLRSVADLLLDLALELAAAPDFRSAIGAVLESACSASELPVGEVWIPERRGGGLVRAGSWEREGFESFRDSAERIVIRMGRGLPGRAAELAEPVVEPNLREGPGFTRHEAATAAGLRWGLAAPVLRGEKVVAVLVLLGEAPPRIVEETVHVVSAAAAQLGAVFERKRADEARSVQAAIVDDARTAIIGKTLDGEIVSWNKGAQELYGYQPDEVLGEHISILAPPDRAGEIEGLMRRLRRGEVIDPYETVRVRKNGSRIRIELSISPVKDALGRLRGASAVARDITRERQLEDELRRTQRMDSLGRLAGGIAHDFNNLLTVLVAETDTLLSLDEELSREERLESLQEIRRVGQRASSLTRQLLSFARQESREPRSLDLNALIRDLEGMLVRVLRTDVRLETRLADRLWAVRMDPTHVEQVLVNLAVNAREAMPKGGRLTIETANVSLGESYVFEHATVPVGDYVLLTVTDTGQGMSDEIQAKIFDPFFTTRQGEGGSGLGLSTCYGIVRQAGGHIWVYSEPGMGATFKIYLPRTARDPSTRSVPSTADSVEAWEAEGVETVLLVEDQPEVRSVGARGLRRFGYRVLLASNGEEALKVLRAHPGVIDIMVTDVVMPGMGGRDLADRVRDIRPDMPILFTSGYADDTLVRDPDDEHDVALLVKPFTAANLASKVREVLDR